MKIKVFNIRLDKANFVKDQEEINFFLEGVKFKKSYVNLIEGKVNYWSVLIHYEDSEKEITQELSEENLSEEEKQIVQALKQWRMEKAKEEDVPNYFILSNKSLISLAINKPKNIDQLTSVHGIGEVKKNQFGDSIIALLNTF